MDNFGFLGANDIVSSPTGQGANGPGHGKPLYTLTQTVPEKNSGFSF